MDPDQIRRRAPVLWLFVALLVVLVCVLAVLQYNWIGEISVNEQKQRQYDLQTAANFVRGYLKTLTNAVSMYAKFVLQ